jgi:hypothetical protein
MPRAYVEIMYGDDKKLILVSHKLSHEEEGSELAQLIQQGNKKQKKQRVHVDSFLDKTDLSPHILIGGDSTVNASFFSDEALGNSAENIINFYRIGGLKARLVIWDTNDTIFTSNLTLFTKNTSDEQRDKMRATANKALQRTNR